MLGCRALWRSIVESCSMLISDCPYRSPKEPQDSILEQESIPYSNLLPVDLAIKHWFRSGPSTSTDFDGCSRDRRHITNTSQHSLLPQRSRLTPVPSILSQTPRQIEHHECSDVSRPAGVDTLCLDAFGTALPIVTSLPFGAGPMDSHAFTVLDC